VATGTAVLDFGAFPGKSDASANVVGQAAIVAGSLAEAWIRPVASADHTADEHMLETLKVFAGNIVAGVGFTIYGFNTSQINEDGPPLKDVNNPTGMGIGTRLYGQWNVAWVWL
jgi:hypothetical protein